MSTKKGPAIAGPGSQPAAPAFVGIYSSSSKSTTIGGLAALNAGKHHGGGSPYALSPSRQRDGSPFTRRGSGTAAGGTTGSGGASPARGRPMRIQDVSSDRLDRPTASGDGGSSLSGAPYPRAGALSGGALPDAHVRSGSPRDRPPVAAWTAPADSGIERTASETKQAAQGAAPKASRNGLKKLLGDSAGAKKDGQEEAEGYDEEYAAFAAGSSGDEQEPEGEAEAEGGADASRYGGRAFVSGLAEASSSKARALLGRVGALVSGEVSGLVARSRSMSSLPQRSAFADDASNGSQGGGEGGGEGEGDLPRLGVRFPAPPPAALKGAVPAGLQRRGSVTLVARPQGPSRSTSFSARGSGGSFTAGGGRSGASFTAARTGPATLYQVKWLDFGVSPEQATAKAAAERIAHSVLAKHAARADEARAFPRESLAAAGKEGFGGLAVPAAAGGLGLRCDDCALVFEALGMGDTALAGYLVLHNMVAWIVANFAAPSMQQQILRHLASTNLLAAYAASEPSSGSDFAATATTAKGAPGGGYVLSGDKALVAGAGVADVYLVLARTAEAPTKGLSLFLVNRSAQGLTVGRPERSGGWRSIPLAGLALEEVAVRADALVGREGAGADILEAALDHCRVWLAAASVGGAQLALDYCIHHDKGRRQGTKAVTDLQAVQFRMVDLHAELQAARLLVRSAAQQMDAKAPGRMLAACQAKQFATDTAAAVAAEACGLMGGAGMLGDHPPERIARDLRLHTVVAGANEQLLGRVFAEMEAAGGRR
ncbi:hypothetical protein HYH03_012868 [Edaphochlamys debaryana]|uniref:Acyl-CoA dehydrogenase n=1 Tax=Edaphochlamys debaryana TaxID=47281 RepID=A0A835XRQ8_9CHLO|nr:hypothetical protein HYH03_012868 [Edaphochlamys debaryana]|eukprot:KAG2488549.1 hypothetical protein HYH03_012868 [Edaphochlamys debaryana]